MTDHVSLAQFVVEEGEGFHLIHEGSWVLRLYSREVAIRIRESHQVNKSFSVEDTGSIVYYKIGFCNPPSGR